MNFSGLEKKLIWLILFITGFGVIYFFDKALGIGILFIVFLNLITFFIFIKAGLNDKELFYLFLIAFLFHLGVALFVYYANFQPFSNGYGDHILYHDLAKQIAQRVLNGNFSLQGIDISHYYPVIIGYIYAFTLPNMLIGQLFNVWIFAVSIIFLYLIVREISGSKKWAFLIGLAATVYPSYIFYGSLLIREVFVILLSLAGLLYAIKLIKSFSWRDFLFFFVVLTGLIHFRFYIGYVLLFTFILCWLAFSKLNLKDRLAYALIVIPILGLSPWLLGQGYYGIATIKGFITPQQVVLYRERVYPPSVAYTPPAQPEILTLSEPPIEQKNLILPEPSKPPLIQSELPISQPEIQETAPPVQADTSSGFSIIVKTEFGHPLKFLENYLKAFIFVVLGPFPFQMRYARHFIALIETLPWYFLFFFIIQGIIASVRRYRHALPLAVFGFGVFIVLALFINNFGVVTRIRMPAFLSLLCLIPLGFARYGRKFKDGKIKVCHATTVDSSIRFLLLNQIKNLQKNGYEMSAVCSDGKWIKEIESQGIKVKTIKMTRKISPFSDLVALFRLIIFFKKEKFDIVHVHTPKAGFLAQLGAKMAGAPIIVNTIHGLYFQESDHWPKKVFFILTEKIQAFCSDLIFSVNKEDVGTMIKEKICGPDLIKYSGDGINLERFNPEIFSQEFIKNKKEKLGIGSSKKVIGIVARLVEEKGYLDLFAAFKIIIGRFPESLLLIAGPLEQQKKDAINIDAAKEYGIEKSILFLGERTDIVDIYSLMDIFVLPSHREGIGLSILEASAMKMPVVATDIRGCREAVDDNRTGILVPVKNPQKLADAIIYLLENPEIGKKMGSVGREKVEKQFDEKLVFSRMEEGYKKLINEKL